MNPSKDNSILPYHHLTASLSTPHALPNRDYMLLRNNEMIRNHLVVNSIEQLLFNDLLQRRKMMMLRNSNNLMNDLAINNQIASANITQISPPPPSPPPPPPPPPPPLPPPPTSTTALSKFGLDILGYVANNASALSPDSFKHQQQDQQQQQQQKEQQHQKQQHKRKPPKKRVVVNELDEKNNPIIAAKEKKIWHHPKNDNKKNVIYIDKLRDIDVLCGRGGAAYSHPGNKRFREVINDMKLTYMHTDKKLKKTNVSFNIVDYVCNYGGRFVKKEVGTDKYFLLLKSEARKKTSQALREQKKEKNIKRK